MQTVLHHQALFCPSPGLADGLEKCFVSTHSLSKLSDGTDRELWKTVSKCQAGGVQLDATMDCKILKNNNLNTHPEGCEIRRLGHKIARSRAG
jgi:hypothetical protein